MGLLEAGVKDSTSNSLEAGLKFDLPKETLKKIIAASNLHLSFDEIKEILSHIYKNVNGQELVQVLVAHGLDIHTTDSNGYTLLHNYICDRNSEMIKWLLELDQNNTIDLHQSLTHRDEYEDTPLDIAISDSEDFCVAELKTCIKNKLQEVCPNLCTAIEEKKDDENDWYTIAVALIKVHKKRGSFKNALIKKGDGSDEILSLPQYALRLSGNQALLNFLKDQGVTFNNTYKASNVCHISPDSLHWLLDNDFKPTETDYLSHLVFALFENEDISDLEKTALYKRIFEECYSNDKICQLLQALQLPKDHCFYTYNIFFKAELIKAGLIDEVAGRGSFLTIGKQKYKPSSLALCYPGNQELLNYLKGKGIKFDTFYNRKKEKVTGSAIYHMARSASSDSLHWLLDNGFLPHDKECLSDIVVDLDKNKNLDDKKIKALLVKMDKQCSDFFMSMVEEIEMPCLYLLGLENSVNPKRLLCWIKRMKNLDSQKEHLQALDIEKNEEPFWLAALSSWKCMKDSQLITETSVSGQILKELMEPLGSLESEKKNHIRVCVEIIRDEETSKQLRSTLKAICKTIFAKDYEGLKAYASKKSK